MYVVVATFEIKPEGLEAFLPLIRAQAENSLSKEPDCHCFDVCQDGTTFLLYELYTDRAAFDAHLASAHFAQFDADVKDLLASKTVATFTRL